MNREITIAHTKNWIASMVIGLELCPFAEKEFKNETIRYIATDVSQAADFTPVLLQELETLASSNRSQIATTFLIHPNVLTDFFDFNAYLRKSEKLLRDKGYEGVVQLVGFHPDYLFQDVDFEAAQNYTNRSPYPMIHLLREEMITEVARRPDELLEIPKRNIRTLEALGTEKILEKLKSCIPHPKT